MFEMVTKRQIILDSLQIIYDRAVQTSSSRTFFLSLYEYIDTFDTNTLLEPVWQSINFIKKSDTAELVDIECKAREEMRQTYQDLKKYVEERSVTLPAVIEELNDFKSCENGTMVTSLGIMRSLHGQLSYALMTLTEDKENDNLDFCKKYGTIDKNGRIISWNFSPSFIAWEEERKTMDRIQLTKVWYSWEKLVLFYTHFRDYEKIQKNNIDKNNLFNLMGSGKYMDEIKIALEEKKQDPSQIIYEFKHEDYLLYLQRVHAFTKMAVLQNSNEDLLLEAKRHWTYEPSSGVLFVNNKVAQFKPNSLRAKIVELMTKTEDNKKKNWSWDELIEEIEGLKDPEPKPHKIKIYDAVKGANEYIASKTGITDFLRYDTNMSQINPTYLS